MPPNPKRTPRGRTPPEPARRRASDLPFDEREVTPLHEDDPRPQRVPQYPSTAARRAKRQEESIPTAFFDSEQQDAELPSSYGAELSENGHTPAFLYVEKGPGAGQLVPVPQGPLVIGRASVSDLRLQHPSISRRHAQLTRTGERFYIKDFGSQNGTYVNRQRIATELEVRPGDLIALGNALIKLRGPGAATAQHAPSVRKVARPAPTSRSSAALPVVPARQSRAAMKVALLGGAVGFGLAGIVMFVLIKLPGNPSYESAPPRAAMPRAAVAKTPPVAPVQAAPVSNAGGVKVEADHPTVRPSDREKAADDRIKAEMAAKQAEARKLEEQQARERPERERAERERGNRNGPATRVASRNAEPANESAPSARRGVILARYEDGQISAAIDLARRSNESQLLAKLTRFRTEYEAAKAAFESNEGAAAISHYKNALRADEQLSSGWSKYGVEIRRQLSNLYGLAGSQHQKNGNTSAAVKAYEASVKYDPENTRARSALSQLRTGDARKTADDAFESQSERPAKKKPASSSRRNDIDAAFGD